jgi:hypothetical protein
LLPVIADGACAWIFVPLAVVVLLISPIRGDAQRGAPTANGPIEVLKGPRPARYWSDPEELLVVVLRAKAEAQTRGLPVAAEVDVTG